MHDDDFTKGARGQFRGDFTRDTFDPSRQFSRVLMQQGRVQMDSDWNEQVSIITHYLRTLTADLVGPHGAPRQNDGATGEGFKISADGKSFRIHQGHYYVGGVLCQNDRQEDASGDGLLYSEQPDNPLTAEEKETGLPDGGHLVYLDVWERHLSYVEDDYMREKALGGPDTAARAQVVWQVKVRAEVEIEKQTPYDDFLMLLADDIKPGTGRLKARARTSPEDNNDPCLTAPEASYRGAENQLYRVEIHHSSEDANGPSFKWSRENGAVIFPITEFSGGEVMTLEHLGRDCRFGLQPNDWVELVDDDYILQNQAAPLLQIKEVDTANSQVILTGAPQSPVATDPGKHPYLRRWDQTEGDADGVPVKAGAEDTAWIALEDGVEIQFPAGAAENNEPAYVYRTGDYWLIPARTATGDVEWPGPVDDPKALPPQGVDHHYAPLARIKVSNGDVDDVEDLRRKFIKMWKV
ncbi:DUF6519 domain-containing protein [Marinobacter sp. X15-166B]|uniref:DUF6519 domain-containing protein n=1 Tax=Marinobacter sp. X15-166B TaxID=1897620 RepID=UPI00085C672E|nr:DUF6519 domain-containing protein [Marinobacter sp. X15-166B]OEY66765.1 hypothetical protein BG841_10070 [Marinobacter sp. X15-166B]